MKHPFMRFPDFKDKVVTLSYDDGVVYDERLIEIMSKNGLKGTFNINSGGFNPDNIRRLSKEKAYELYTASGQEVAVHGRRHLSLAEVDEAMATEDVINDRVALEEMFGTVITGMAYNVVEILRKCGITYSRTTVSTEDFTFPQDWLELHPTCHHNNPKLMELAHKFLEEEPRKHIWARHPRMFYLWGHSYEFDTNDNWDVIEKFAEFVGGRENIWYATNIEIYDYVKAYQSLQTSYDKKIIHNPSAIDVWFEMNEKIYCIEGGKTLTL